MSNLVKHSIKRVLHAAGIEAHRYRPHSSPLAQLIVALGHHHVDLVFDVGANEGQFAKELRAGGYTGEIVSFEPVSSAHARLLRASGHDKSWHVPSRCAVGDRLGEIELNIAGNSVSSSILPMLSSHCAVAPESSYRGREAAPIVTLDSVALTYLHDAEAPFLKIDTQGYEWQVLDGAREILPQVRGIQMELSLVPLYEGQRLWRECVERLEREGFALWAMHPVFVDPVIGRTLQWDGLFFRP